MSDLQERATGRGLPEAVGTSGAGRPTRGPRGFGVEAPIYVGVGVFFIVVDVIYFVWSHEATGSVLLLFTCLLGLLPGLYLTYHSRRMRARPEDLETATAADPDAHGAVGSFPDSSIWPVVIGFGGTMCVVGLVYPFWPIAFGVSIIIGAMTGVIIESRRGGNV
jgi:hypothetical protein